jgi:membrane-associated protease RseP (regulator of RpoE activity)
MRLIVQPVAGGFELCARLGLVLVPSQLRCLFEGARIVHAVLDRSPGARAGIEPRDIIVSIDGTPWDSVQRLTFSDRRPSEITAQTFVARYFAVAKILVRVPPEPYRPLDDIGAEAASVVAARPTPDSTPYRKPRFDFDREWLATLARRRRIRW